MRLDALLVARHEAPGCARIRAAASRRGNHLVLASSRARARLGARPRSSCGTTAWATSAHGRCRRPRCGCTSTESFTAAAVAEEQVAPLLVARRGRGRGAPRPWRRPPRGFARRCGRRCTARACPASVSEASTFDPVADLLQAPGDAEGVRGGLQHGERVGGNLSRVGVLERVMRVVSRLSATVGSAPCCQRVMHSSILRLCASMPTRVVLERRIRSGGRYGLRFAVHVVYDLKALSHVGADGSA